MEVQNLFANSGVNITAEGKRQQICDEYVTDLVKNWDNQFTILSTIAKTQTQAAYLIFASEFKSKFNYFLRTIPNIRHLLLPLKEQLETSSSQP